MKQAKKSVKSNKEHIEKTVNPETHFIEKSNEFGKIRLTDSVIIAIIKRAICNVHGVARFSGSSIMDSIANMISSQKLYDRSISMIINENNSLDVEAKINVAYGENIPTVATKVQNTVRDEVHNLLGLNIRKVDIIIQEIERITDIKETAINEK